MKNIFSLLFLSVSVIIGCKKADTVSPTPPVISKLPTVTTTPPVTMLSSSGASSGYHGQTGGTVTDDGGAAIIEQGICWSTSQHPTVADSTSKITPPFTSSFTCTVTTSDPMATLYVRAYAKNSVGIGYGTEEAFTAGYWAGMDYGGGIVFWVDQTTFIHGLIAAKSDLPTTLPWTNGFASIGGSSDDYGGAFLTSAIVSILGNTGNYAAKACKDYRGGGYTDWFLPSYGELNLLYNKRNIVGGFSTDYFGDYWSSTGFNTDANRAWTIRFSGNTNAATDKSFPEHVRPVRAF